jgi:uncharacterized protein (TIGR00730 family)
MAADILPAPGGPRSVAVFCGSSLGQTPRLRQVAHETGELLARAKITLIYGGANVGLMGVMADAALAQGGRVIGVIPNGLWPETINHQGLLELHKVPDLATRKAMMTRLADAFIVLPGGLGTLDELAEVLAHSAIGLHQKPTCVILLLQAMQDQGLVHEKALARLAVVSSPAMAIRHFAGLRLPVT